MRLVGAGTANSVSGQVSHVEKLGEASLLYVDVGQKLQAITVRVPGTATEGVGETVHVQWPADRIHVFGSDGQACYRTLDLPA